MDYANAINIADNFIAQLERFSSVPYFDVNGYAIGYGNHYYEDGSPVSADDDPIDQTRAMQLLDYYVQQNAQVILANVTVDLTDNQLAALISLRYNCGHVPDSVLSLINSGADPATVASQFSQVCTTSAGQASQTLFQRRELEGTLFDTITANPATTLLIVAGVFTASYFMFFKDK
jgi:lysozyme